MTMTAHSRHALAPCHTLVIHRADGEIVAIHHFAVLPGVEHPAEAVLIEAAIENAISEGLGVREDLHVLTVDPAHLRPGTHYRVDRMQGCLVPHVAPQAETTA
jgi:hypothetical protein